MNIFLFDTQIPIPFFFSFPLHSASVRCAALLMLECGSRPALWNIFIYVYLCLMYNSNMFNEGIARTSSAWMLLFRNIAGRWPLTHTHSWESWVVRQHTAPAPSYIMAWSTPILYPEHNNAITQSIFGHVPQKASQRKMKRKCDCEGPKTYLFDHCWLTGCLACAQGRGSSMKFNL